MKKTLSRGFTLIELLVVIAIIGILSGIVLTSLGSARNKAKDARVTTSMSQLRSIEERMYDSSAGKYVSITADADYIALNADIAAQGGTLTLAGASGSFPDAGYRAYATLPSNTLNAWCVDSAGNSLQVVVSALPAGTPLKCK